jgi:hypothetical protein
MRIVYGASSIHAPPDLSPPRLPQFENVYAFRALTGKMRIMATMPYLPRCESNKQREMILC